MKKFLDNIATIFIVFIVFLIIIPLDSVVLDIMLIINISLSLIILITVLNIKESLEFSIFPSVLLVTTLLRVALNVSSTRLILGNSGNAGQIIKTFGEFVIGGNPVVGFVIFIIIVVVQFLVITKGSERVAEVAARFTLDAMPGKQMAIDADLNSGLINDEMARTRRRKIQREADFFGSMDGATKFVKGDAIVSIIIVLINSIGGTIIGMVQGGKTFQEVLSIYIIATVGDGLVSQIPALLISTATGLIVTRAASEENLATDIKNQIFSYPVALLITGGVILVMSLLPGFPTLLLVLIGLFMLFFGNKIRKAKLVEEKEEVKEKQPVSELEFYKNPDNVYTLLNVEPIEVDFGYSLIPLIDESRGGNFLNRVVIFRKQFAAEMGMVVPSVHLRDNSELKPNRYIIKIKGNEVASGEVLPDHFLAMSTSDDSKEIKGIDTIEPAFKIPAKWITADMKEKAQMLGYTVIDPLSVIVTHLSETIRKHAYEFLGRKEVISLINNLKKTNKEMVEDIIPSIVPAADLQRVLENLLMEGIPIKDLQTIIETMAKYAATVKDTDMLTEYVRQALKRTITHKFVHDDNLKVITINPELENLILTNIKKTSTGSYVALESDVMQKVVASHITEVNKIKEMVSEVVILTSPVVRFYYRKLMEQFCDDIVVLSYSEIETNVNIQSIGTISV